MPEFLISFLNQIAKEKLHEAIKNQGLSYPNNNNKYKKSTLTRMPALEMKLCKFCHSEK